MYLDDTTIYFNFYDFPLANWETEINCELEKVNTWLKLNKLAINVKKTKCLLFLSTPIYTCKSTAIFDEQ